MRITITVAVPQTFEIEVTEEDTTESLRLKAKDQVDFNLTSDERKACFILKCDDMPDLIECEDEDYRAMMPAERIDLLSKNVPNPVIKATCKAILENDTDHITKYWEK